MIKREQRKKERTIEEVKKKVDDWRHLYNYGLPDKMGKLQKLNLDKASELIGYSRKTLDDYYTVIKRGINFNFDF